MSVLPVSIEDWREFTLTRGPRMAAEAFLPVRRPRPEHRFAAVESEGWRSEIVRVDEKGHLIVEDIFGFKQTGVDSNGNAVGEFYATGNRPKCLERLHSAGIAIPDSLFHKRRIEVGGSR